jgi:electron transfer flavoprotein beta subunit
MKIVVLLRMVPDVVEELEIAPDGKSLDRDSLRMILSESDDHALEEALILKERYGGEVTAVGLSAADIDDALFTALGKGADRAIRIDTVEEDLTAREAAAILEKALARQPDLTGYDLIVTGVQAIDDLDSLLAPMIADRLRLPFVGIVTAVRRDGSERTLTVVKEFPGGVRGEFEVDLPAVLGIQAAEKPPRYLPVAKLRAAMKSRELESAAAEPAPPDTRLLQVIEITMPRETRRAEILEGDAEGAAEHLCAILSDRGLV